MPADPAPITIPPSPREGEPAATASPSPETLGLLARRRSTPIAMLGPPGPSRAQITEIVRLAARVPDHGKLGPWRFIALEGEARARAGAVIAAMLERRAPEAPAEAIEHERGWFLRSPASVIVVYAGKPHDRIPEWEQRVSTSMAAYQTLLAAHAMGFAGVLLTGRVALDPEVRPLLGLAEHERIIGTVHLGTAKGEVAERARPAAQLDWY